MAEPNRSSSSPRSVVVVVTCVHGGGGVAEQIAQLEGLDQIRVPNQRPIRRLMRGGKLRWEVGSGRYKGMEVI